MFTPENSTTSILSILCGALINTQSTDAQHSGQGKCSSLGLRSKFRFLMPDEVQRYVSKQRTMRRRAAPMGRRPWEIDTIASVRNCLTFFSCTNHAREMMLTTSPAIFPHFCRVPGVIGSPGLRPHGRNHVDCHGTSCHRDCLLGGSFARSVILRFFWLSL